MTRGKPLAAVLVAAGVAVAPTTSAFAAASATTCDAYSHKCTDVLGQKITKPPAVQGDDATTLPFTGAEILLMTTAGAAALGGGVVLVAASRRRRSAPA
jgi:hypothetical protein